MKAKKLPSGSWRCRVYWYTDEDGKKHYKSFTCQDPTPKGKRTCEAEAAAWAMQKKDGTGNNSRITFNNAIRLYVEARDQILSPSTKREYMRYVKNGMPMIGNTMIDAITQNDVQKLINTYAIDHAPKTVKNLHGLISTVMKAYRPEFILRTHLPQMIKKEKYIPTNEEMKAVMREVEGTDMEVPVLLGMYGMRRSEICGLESSNINGNVIHICQNKVRGVDDYELKGTKTYTSDRYIELPDFIVEKFPKEGFVTEKTPAAITCAFEDIVKKIGASKKFTFHGLRHYFVSTLHGMGIPDADIIKLTGHSSVTIMENVYLHSTKDRMDDMNKQAKAYFSALYDTKYDTK